MHLCRKRQEADLSLQGLEIPLERRAPGLCNPSGTQSTICCFEAQIMTSNKRARRVVRRGARQGGRRFLAAEVSGGWRLAGQRMGRTGSPSSRPGLSGRRTEPLRRKALHTHPFRSGSGFPGGVDLVA